jgi:hypothetical protein
MEEQFYIGQNFEGIYPPEAAAWCNANNAHIEVTGTTVTTVTDKIPATEEIEKVIVETVIDPETGEETEVEKTITEYAEVTKESEPYEKEVKVYTIVENAPPPEPTPEEIIKGYEDAVQAHLDATAQSRDYDNTYTCLSYLSSTDETWRRESNAFNVWRDSVWRKCHEILNAVMAGETPPPTVEELIAQLPVIDWNDN